MKSTNVITRGAAVFLTACLLLAGTTLASDKKPDIDFKNVVDSTQGFSDFGTFPAINNQGAVVFVANKSGAGQGVFRSGEGQVTTMASTSDGFRFFVDDLAVNASGVVVVTAVTNSGSIAIFTADGQSRTLIADSAANGLFGRFIGATALNDAGTVAFMAARLEPGLPRSIFTGNGGPLTTLLSTSSTGFVDLGNVAINDAGKIAFTGFQADGTIGTFVGANAPVGVVTTKTRPELDGGFFDPVINNGGTIAVIASRAAGGLEVFTGNAQGVTVRNDPDHPFFTNAEHPSVNNHGAVAFFGFSVFDPTAPTGIFMEASGGQSLIPVIRPGDALFGSTVTAVDLGRFGLNDRFELAFQYSLADGRSGIAIASFHGEKEVGIEGQ